MSGGCLTIAKAVMRYRAHRRVAFQFDVELLVLGARAVIGEVERLLDQAVEVDLAALPLSPRECSCGGFLRR